MSLLEFLRKSNDVGQIAGWLEKEHKTFLKSQPPDMVRLRLPSRAPGPSRTA